MDNAEGACFLILFLCYYACHHLVPCQVYMILHSVSLLLCRLLLMCHLL